MKLKVKAVFVIITLLLDVLVFYLFSSASRLIYDYGADNFQTYVSNSSYEAIEKVIPPDRNLSSIVAVVKNSSGEIEMISTNTAEVNIIAKDLSNYCFNSLQSYMQSGVDVPIGAFSGVNLLAAVGPKIRVNFIGNLSVSCEIKREFVSAGINQTRSILSAVIVSEVYVYSFRKNEKFVCGIEVPLYDTVIVGEVPENYFTAQIVAGSVKKE